MAAESLGTEGRREPAAWRHWARVGALAFLLLAASEALWLWQTWPVRELLQAPAAPVPFAGAR